jgi:hypothetical protein
MSPTVILVLALFGLTVVAIAAWIRSRALRRHRSERSEAEPERFETTMGELRDLREALRPTERAAQQRSPRKANAQLKVNAASSRK